jgi:hypothetical protein
MKVKVAVIAVVLVAVVAVGAVVYRSQYSVTPEVRSALTAAMGVKGLIVPAKHAEARDYIRAARLAARTEKDRRLCDLVEEYQETIVVTRDVSKVTIATRMKIVEELN